MRGKGREEMCERREATGERGQAFFLSARYETLHSMYASHPVVTRAVERLHAGVSDDTVGVHGRLYDAKGGHFHEGGRKRKRP